MGRKLKGRTLKELLSKGWTQVVDPNASRITDDIVAQVVREHNQSYHANDRRPNVSSNGDRLIGLPTGWVSGRNTIITPKADDVWHCGVKDVSGCPIAVEPQVEITYDLWNAFIELCNEYDTEWMAYLKGEVNQDTGRAMVTECYFPPQSASGAHVEQPDDNYRPESGTIGAIHSHVKMAASPSKVDEDHANWPIEIIINARGEYYMSLRVKLECGRYSRVKGKVFLKGARASDVYRERLKDAMAKGTTASSASGTSVGDYDNYILT